jgi:hypothetical protein
MDIPDLTDGLTRQLWISLSIRKVKDFTGMKKGYLVDRSKLCNFVINRNGYE